VLRAEDRLRGGFPFRISFWDYVMLATYNTEIISQRIESLPKHGVLHIGI